MEYIKYESDYCAQVVELLNICFPDKQISEKSFLWKHFDAYFNGKTRGMLAVDGNIICAFVCFTPIYIMQNGQRIAFYSCAIQATHPDYRRRGIVSDLTLQIEKELGDKTNYLGFSNESGVKIDKFSKRINYAIVGQMVKQCILSLPYRNVYKTNEVEVIDPNFVQNTPSPTLKIDKNSKYINWRYERNPKRKYYYLEVKDDSGVIGCVVFNKKRLTYEISEILTKDDSVSQKEIVKAFLNFAFRRGKIFTSCSYLENNYWKQSFPFLSFKRKIDIFFTVKSTNSDYLKADNWLISGGDIQ